jgi:phosphoglycolate phosphatase-like HAD superfamily hydrolase
MSKSKALVLFDIDGTLLRGAGQHHKQALIDGIRKVTGLETHLEGVATSGMLDRDLIRSMLRARGESERRIKAALLEIMAECQSAYVTSCAVDLSPFVCAGVQDFIGEAKNHGAVLGLVTGNLSRIGWRKMELAGIRDYFSVGAFAEDGTSRARLARLAWRRAIQQNLVKRSACVSLIGDHGNDIRAAKANGFQSIAVTTGFTPWEELQRSEPDVLVRDLSELNINKVLFR